MKKAIKLYVSILMIISICLIGIVPTFAASKVYTKSSTTNMVFMAGNEGVSIPYGIQVKHNIHVTELRGPSDKEVEEIQFFAYFQREIDPVLVSDVSIDASEILLEGDSLSFDYDSRPQIIPTTDYWVSVVATPYTIYSMNRSYSVDTSGIVGFTNARGQFSSAEFSATLNVS